MSHRASILEVYCGFSLKSLSSDITVPGVLPSPLQGRVGRATKKGDADDKDKGKGKDNNPVDNGKSKDQN